MKKFLVIFALLFTPLCEGQFQWPTYTVNAPVNIYKAMTADSSNVAHQATGDTAIFAGITQASVVTSHGTVPLAVSGASQIQVGSTPVVLGALVTSDANGNAVPFAPTADGNSHCVLGSVIAGNVSAGGFIYVRVLPYCTYVPTPSGSPPVTSVFTRLGAIVANSGDYTCAQVTGCPTTVVTAFNGRSGSVVAASGDYVFSQIGGTLSAAQVPTGGSATNFLNGAGNYTTPTGAVSSVFGRTGAVVAATNDYTLNMIGNPTASKTFTFSNSNNVLNLLYPGAMSPTGGTTNFEIENSVAATSLTNQFSPSFQLCGNIWIGVNKGDCWSQQVVPGTGTNPTSTYTIAYQGSTAGEFSVSLPDFTSTSIIDRASSLSLTDITSIAVDNLLISSTSPSVSSGFGTGASVTFVNGTVMFKINVGTGGTAQTGTIALPAAGNGWGCWCTDITTQNATVSSCKQIGAGSSTTSQIGNFTDLGVAGAWSSGDTLIVHCFAF
jgi:hypothetical protein